MGTTDPTKPIMGVWKVKRPDLPALTEQDAADFRGMSVSVPMPISNGYEIKLPSGVIMQFDEWDAY